jgi:site-specific DNA-methyltransferase (adenine-specific)
MLIQPYYSEDGITIYCGDCRDVLPTLPKVDLVLTDPPYGVDWQSNRRAIKHQMIANDGSLEWLEAVFVGIYRAMRDDSLCISFYGWPDAEMFLIAWKAAGFKPKSHIVWVKNNMGLGWFTRGQHEQAYILTKGCPVKPKLAISDVIFCDGTGNALHPTQKPTRLISTLIKPFAAELILDPFMGSGTTLVAAKQLGRRAIGIELEKRYCDIAIERLRQQVLPLEPMPEQPEQLGLEPAC